MSHTTNSASYQEFLKYKSFIIKSILDEFGREYVDDTYSDEYIKSYHNAEKMWNRWFHIYKYSGNIEKFLIKKSQEYLYTNVENQRHELKFLRALTRHMADYLSEYTMRKSSYADKDARAVARRYQKEFLFDEIYTKCNYIKRLVARQSIREKARQKQESNSSIRSTKPKRPRIKKGCITDEFNNMKCVRQVDIFQKQK